MVLALAAEREVEPVLQRLVHVARELGGARYAALGVPDGEGGFARFITSGMSDELIASMGPLPRTARAAGRDARVAGALPDGRRDAPTRASAAGGRAAHPLMRSFLGVPMLARGEIIGALYLTDKEGAIAFSEEDERRIVLLAAHAALAIDNARLHERSRELTIAEERNRLARELHDSVVQQLFGGHARGGVGGRAARARPGRGRGAARAGAGAGARRDRGAALRGLRAAAGLGRGRGAGGRAAQARRRAAAGDRAGDRAARRGRGGGGAGAAATTRRRRSSGSRRRRCRTRCATRAPSGSRCGSRRGGRSC